VGNCKGIRTSRHHALKNMFARQARRICSTVLVEQDEGGLRHDILINDGATGRSAFDVGVVSTPRPRDTIQWPTDQEVQDVISERARHPPAPPEFFWEDHSEEPVHPDTLTSRTFRELAATQVLAPAISEMCASKISRFTRLYSLPESAGSRTFAPLVVSAGGRPSSHLASFLRWMTHMAGGIRKKSALKKALSSEISCSLIHYNHMLAFEIGSFVGSAAL
jgi:hypothetical protein